MNADTSRQIPQTLAARLEFVLLSSFQLQLYLPQIMPSFSISLRNGYNGLPTVR